MGWGLGEGEGGLPPQTERIGARLMIVQIGPNSLSSFGLWTATPRGLVAFSIWTSRAVIGPGLSRDVLPVNLVYF